MKKRPGKRGKAKRAHRRKELLGCVIPKHPGDEELRRHLLDRMPHREREVVQYVEWQMSKESPNYVTHLERLKVERVGDNDHELWDVHTTDGRWWVVTDPTNLYSHTAFPSADYVLTFHIGLMVRMAQRSARSVETMGAARFAATFRQWEQVALALDSAKEQEDLQAIGVKCRECLLAFIRDARQSVEVPEGTVPPKAADFNAWTELIANWCLPGAQLEEARHYLKQVATSCWKLVQWVTHGRNARHVDAEMAVAAVRHALEGFASAHMRKMSKQPNRCPKCASFMLHSEYVSELPEENRYRVTCEGCGWQNPPFELTGENVH
jgi:hypothetical protein